MCRALDLILTQDLCRACAVPAGDFEAALGVIGYHAAVVSLDPSTLDDVIACIGIVGDATGTAPRAQALMQQLRDRIAAVRRATTGRDRPRTVALEWSALAHALHPDAVPAPPRGIVTNAER